MSTWRELRERRIIQIVLAYLAVAWGALEIVNLLVERGVVPEFVWRVVFVLALFGFLASLVVGWYHGEKGEQAMTRSEVVLLVLVALGGLGTSGWVVATATAGPDVETAPAELRDIAVLYFEAADSAVRPVADGLTEALIGQLRTVRTLEVVSSNAVQPFRGRPVSIDSVGRALDVGTVIDGSVERESGGRLRVTTSLREAAAGGLIDRITVDVPEDDVLALVDSVSAEIARVLRTNLGQEVRIRRDRAAAGNSAAWLLLQRGRAAFKQAQAAAEDDPEAAGLAFQRADSLFAEAVRADTAWLRPHLERAALAYRQSYMARDLATAREGIDRSLDHARRVLERDPSNAEGLAIQGTTRYWRSILPIDHDPEVRHQLREAARADLERAVELDPGIAMAHSTLSHLYYDGSRAEAVLAAQNALAADAYLSDADNVMWRLFLGAYDLEMFPQARRWCEEGARRFPVDHRFALCRLQLMTAPVAPDPDGAWNLARRVDSLLAHPEETPEHYYAHLLVGGVLGRAGLADSARAVVERYSAPATLDPTRELLALEAFMYKLIGDEERAVDRLQQYVASNPDHRFQEGGDRNWWWRGLEDEPGFQQLVDRN